MLIAVLLGCHSEECNKEESPTMDRYLNKQGPLRSAQSDRIAVNVTEDRYKSLSMHIKSAM